VSDCVTIGGKINWKRQMKEKGRGNILINDSRCFEGDKNKALSLEQICAVNECTRWFKYDRD
jgi:hypothetical protein